MKVGGRSPSSSVVIVWDIFRCVAYQSWIVGKPTPKKMRLCVKSQFNEDPDDVSKMFDEWLPL
jgi:hypothetical protein